MTVSNAPASTPFRIPRVLYLVLCAALLACVLGQVFLAGLGVLVNPNYFALHTAFGHVFGPLILLMLVCALLGRLPSAMTLATLGLLLLYGLQYVFLGLGTSVPFLRAFHVVNALVIFWSAAQLAQGMRPLLVAGRG